MVEISDELKKSINKPGRIGTLSTADADGRPNAAYFGSPRFGDDGTFFMGLGNNRSLKNLEVNPYAVFFCIAEAPVTFTTKADRLYLKVREIQREGALLDMIREGIAQKAGPDAAKMVQAAVTFDVIDIRPMVAMGD